MSAFKCLFSKGANGRGDEAAGKSIGEMQAMLPLWPSMWNVMFRMIPGGRKSQTLAYPPTLAARKNLLTQWLWRKHEAKCGFEELLRHK